MDFTLTPYRSRIGFSRECAQRAFRRYAAEACRQVDCSTTQVEAVAAIGRGLTFQAENESSIPVARSKFGFVATTDQTLANADVGFGHVSLSQRSPKNSSIEKAHLGHTWHPSKGNTTGISSPARWWLSSERYGLVSRIHERLRRCRPPRRLRLSGHERGEANNSIIIDSRIIV